MQPSNITLEPQERGLSTWPTSPKKDLDPPCPSLPHLSVSVDQAEDSDDASSSYNSWSSFSFSSSPTSSDYQCSPDRVDVDAENAGAIVAQKVAESDVCDGRTNSADAEFNHQEQTSSRSLDGSITFMSDDVANSESYPSINMAKMKMADKYSKRTDLFEVSEANKKADPGVQLFSVSALSCKKSSKTLPKTTTPSSSSKEKYLDLPMEEYDKVESSESKGLKLTFRRKSTERLQPPLVQSKEKKIKPPPSIPKLIVQKCKCPEGYSKKELQCSICQTEVKQKDLDRCTTNIKISIDKKVESAGHIDDVKKCLDTSSDKMENACVDNQETTSRFAHRVSLEAPTNFSECLQAKSDVPPKLKPKSKQEEKTTYVTISSSSPCSLSESSLKSTRPSCKTSTPNNKDGEKLNSKEKIQVNTKSSQKLDKSSPANSAQLAPKLHKKENDLSSSECHIKDSKPTKSSSDSPKVYKSSKSHSNSPKTHEVTKTSKPMTPAPVCQSKPIDSSNLTSLNSDPDLQVSTSTPETSLSHDRNGKVDSSSLPSEIHKSKKITKPTPQTEAEKQNRPFSKSSDLYSKPKSSTDSSSILPEIEDKASKPTNSSPIDTDHNKVKNSLTIAHNTSSKIANASNSSPLKHNLQKDKIKSANALSILPEVRNTETIPSHSSQSIPSDAKNDSSIQIQNNQSVSKSAKTSATFESPTIENTVKTSSSLVSNHSKISRSRNSLSLTELDEEKNKPTDFSSLKEDIQIKAKISKSASLIEQGSHSGANRSLKSEHNNKEIKTSIASSQATSITKKESKPSVSKVHGHKLDTKASKLNNEIDKKFNDFVKCSFTTHAISKKSDKVADLSSPACDLKLKHKSGHTSSHTKEASSSLPSIAHTNKSTKSTKTSTLSSEHHEKSSSSKNPTSAEPKLDKKLSKSANVDNCTLLHQTPKQKESSSKVNDQPKETKSNESNEKLSIPKSTDGVLEKDLASFDTLKRNVSEQTLKTSPNSQSEQNCVVQSNKMFIKVPASPNENLDITFQEKYTSQELKSVECLPVFQEKYTSQELKSVECLPVLIHEMSQTYGLSNHNNNTDTNALNVDLNPRLLRKPYYKRSDSAPPPSSSSLLSKTSSSVIQDSSDYATPCRTALLDSIIQQERPKSSPPLTYYCFQSFQNSDKKSPVVILDRLPSPVIELYSMQTMNDAPLLDGPIQLDSKGVCNEENLSQEEHYTSDWNSSDCETNRISSGKLKFTYRKVADKKKYHIKTNRKAQPKNPTPDRTVTGEQLELGLKESYTPTRRQYLRASKCGVRYINDDDDVIEEIMAASWLEDQNILQDKKFTSKKGSVNNSRGMNGGMNGVRKKRGPKSKTLKMAAPKPAKEKPVDENDGLVDPRIKAMSEALRRADETGRNAEYIAFNTSQRHHSFGPNNRSKTNPAKRNVGGKLRQPYPRRKYCFGRKQHATAGAYLKQQNSTMRCTKSKCNFNVMNDKDEHVSYRRRDDLNAQTMNPTNTPLCPDLSCHVGELCSSGKYRNLLKSDVYNARAAEESSSHFIDPRIHMQVQFCEKARKCSCFRCQSAQTLLDENERYRLWCRDNRNILRGNGYERQSTKCQRCCSHCICRAGYNNLIEGNEMYSSFYNQDEKSDNENTENNPADNLDETNLNENDIFITTEPGVTEDSLEEYTLRDYALCLDRHASDEIPRDVDLMGLDYSEFENQEDELERRSERSCARNQAEISDDSWNIQSADEISPSFYSFYFQGPEGKRSVTHGDNHEEGMDKTKMQCTLSKQKMPPTGITKTSSHQQFLCNPQTAPGSANLVPMPQRPCINKPLSILICPSPDNSDYGSPPSLTEYKSPLWCKEKSNSLDPDAHHTVPCCSGAKCVDSHFEEAARPNDDTQEESSYKGDLQQGKQLSKLTLPRIIVSSPSSTNTQSNETPTSVSPSCVSYASFLSPSMYHARRNQRCDSPFRLPYILDSPSKQTVEDVCKSGCDLGSRKFPEEKIQRQSKLPSPKHRRHYQKRLKRVKRPTHSDHLVDSDDSDSTLVYPTVGKVGLCSKHVPSRRSSLGVSSNGLSEVSPNSALNSPNFKSDERCEHTASSDSQSIERRKSELSNLVSDLRESISKSKALKRSRRTNSFSGDSQPKLSDPDICIQRTTNNRPTFERFMSVEAIMDSDTPYATITRGINNTSKCEEIELMKYVSGVCLQRKGEETASSVAETQMYGIEFSHQNQNNCTIINENKKKETNEMVNDSREATEKGNNTLSNFPEVPTDDSDCEGKLMVVIENAESNEVIEGDEAYNKVTSGSYRLTMGPGNRFRKNGRRIAGRRRGKERGLISIQSLLSRKTANKKRPSPRDGLQAHKTLTESTEDDVPRQRKECFSSTLQNVAKSRATVNGAFRKRYSTKRKQRKDASRKLCYVYTNVEAARYVYSSLAQREEEEALIQNVTQLHGQSVTNTG
ncbi:hypothetical protein BgiBS90_016134 [Biomphalaria glabrata]|nr:hypothetical protein BgiBS90_016134 [Biomphalaria glabrata]